MICRPSTTYGARTSRAISRIAWPQRPRTLPTHTTAVVLETGLADSCNEASRPFFLRGARERTHPTKLRATVLADTERLCKSLLRWKPMIAYDHGYWWDKERDALGCVHSKRKCRLWNPVCATYPLEAKNKQERTSYNTALADEAPVWSYGDFVECCLWNP